MSSSDTAPRSGSKKSKSAEEMSDQLRMSCDPRSRNSLRRSRTSPARSSVRRRRALRPPSATIRSPPSALPPASGFFMR